MGGLAQNVQKPPPGKNVQKPPPRKKPVLTGKIPRSNISGMCGMGNRKKPVLTGKNGKV